MFTFAAIIVVDEKGPKPEPERTIECLWVVSAESVLFGKIDMVELRAVTAGTRYENADETNATGLCWPTETRTVYPAQNQSLER